MKNNRVFLIFISLFFLQTTAWAEVSIETSVSRSAVNVGEQLTLDIIISNATGKISNPVISTIEGFTSYSEGHSQEISFINGVSSSRSIFSYILVANSTGHKKIGPFQINIGGKDFKIAAVEVEVTPPSSNQPAPAYANPQAPVSAPPSRALPAGNVGEEDIFVKAWVDKDEAYVNEPVMLTYTLYTRLSATYKGFEKEPVTTGFWVEDFPPDKTVKRTEQFFNGSRYVVADVRKLALFPTQAGVYTVNPGALAANVEVRSDDSFDSFFSYNVFGARRAGFPTSFMTQTISKVLSTSPVAVTVKVLPEAGKPADFSGAVGSFQIDGSIDKNEVEQGNPVTVRIRIRGEGNINTIQTPTLTPMTDFKIYDSSSSTHISKDRLLVEGEKVTETVIVPKKTGTFTIPELGFSYFDPKKQSYQTLKTAAQTLTVKPGTEVEAPTPVSTGVAPVDKEEVPVIAKDVRYIKTADEEGWVQAEGLVRQPLYWFVNLLFAAGIALCGFVSLLRQKGQRDLKGVRFRRSHALARRKLSAASRKLKAEKQDEFYAEVSKAIYNYFADKFNIPSQAVSFEIIDEHSDDASPELVNKTRALFDELSMGRFAQTAKSREDMKKTYALADEIITAFEKVKLK